MGNAFLCRPYVATRYDTNSETSAGPVSNLANDRLGRAWQVPTAGNITLQIDLGSSRAVDTLALLATNASASDVIRWRGADNTAAFDGSGTILYNGSWRSLQASTDAASRPHRQSLLKLSTPVTARHWQANMVLAAPTNFGRAVVGEAFQPGDNFDYGWDWSITDRGKTELSDAGPKGSTLNTKHMQFRWVWGWLTQAEARAKALEIMGYAGSTRPVLFCADPDASDVHNLIGWGRLAEGAKVAQIAVDGFSTAFQIDSDLIFSL